MKKWIVILLMITLSSCTESMDDRVLGVWDVESPFFKARYEITPEQGDVVGRILNYNDGTTKYAWDDENPKYIIQNLVSRDGQIIDAITGATSKSSNPNIKLKVLHEDTLNAQIYIGKQTKQEIWIRQK